MPVEDERTALEAAIAAAPDQPEPYLVFADWLQSRGGSDAAHGELIVLDHAGRDDLDLDPRRRALAPAARVGPHVNVDHWRWGYPRRALLSIDQGGQAFRVDPVAIRALEQLLRHPLLRFLDALHLIMRIEAETVSEILALAGAPRPTTLRRLSIDAYDDDRGRERANPAGDFDLRPLWASYPRLEHLHVSCASVQLGLAHPSSLSSLRLETAVEVGGLDLDRLPRLRRVSLVAEHAPSALIEQLQSLALDELRLDGSPLTDGPPRR